jgi:predicted nucleic acid-binding protein
MIFLDTSAIYAWADTADRHHRAAVRRLERILNDGESLLTHNYVLVEATALLQARLGVDAALKLCDDARRFLVEWIDEDLHMAAVQALQRSRTRRVSLVDHISFLVMRQRRIEVAFAFDDDFAAAGFTTIED